MNHILDLSEDEFVLWEVACDTREEYTCGEEDEEHYKSWEQQERERIYRNDIANTR